MSGVRPASSTSRPLPDRLKTLALLFGVALLALLYWPASAALLALGALLVFSPRWGDRALAALGWSGLPTVGQLTGRRAGGLLIASSAILYITGLVIGAPVRSGIRAVVDEVQTAAALPKGPTPTPARTPQPTPTREAGRIGTVLDLEGWRYRVLQVDVTKTVIYGQGSSAFSVTAEGNWVMVFMELTNTGRTSASITPRDLELRDERGQRYALDATTSASVSQVRGHAAIGDQMRPGVASVTTLMFDVAPGTTGMYLHLPNPGRGSPGRIYLY